MRKNINLAIMLIIPMLMGETAMNTVTLEQAEVLAQAGIDKMYTENKSTIDKDRISEYDYGWVFEVVTYKYLETKDVRDLALGRAKFVVLRNGTVKDVPWFVRGEKPIYTYVTTGEIIRE